MSKSSSKEITAPIIVLVSICLVASFLLAGVYQITAPVIEAREKEAASAARVVVLPSGSTFVPADCELLDGVTEVYESENGAGVTVSTSVKGMNSGLQLMIGVTSNGEIAGISVLSHDETAGIGTKVLDDAYLAKFVGATASDAVDSISGATYTSNGVKNSIDLALEQAKLVK